MKHIIVINAGPRKGWNTDLLLQKAAEGARTAGASAEVIDLYQLEKFTGCRSCFACKRQESYGKCAVQDALYEVLDKIRNADGLIMGSPNYLGNLTAEFRALFERLIFQYLTYNRETPNCNTREIPVLLVMTSNAPEGSYDGLLEGYRQMLSRFIGPAEVLVAANTLQVSDYSIYNWTNFDPADKKRSREEDFPGKLQVAYETGYKMAEGA